MSFNSLWFVEVFGIRAGSETGELNQNQVWNLLQMCLWYATARAFPSADGFYFGFLRNALMGHFLFEFLSWTGRVLLCCRVPRCLRFYVNYAC